MSFSEIIQTIEEHIKYLEYKDKCGRAELSDLMHLENLRHVKASLQQLQSDYFKAREAEKKLSELEINLDASNLSVDQVVIICELFKKYLSSVQLSTIDSVIALLEKRFDKILLTEQNYGT